MLDAGIVTASADDLVTFYRDGFGFEHDVTHTFPEGTVHRLRREDAGLKLYQPTGGAARAERPEPWHGREGFAYAALRVDDVDALVERAVRAGAVVLDGPRTHRPGARFALVADPEGNVWELLQEAPG